MKTLIIILFVALIVIVIFQSFMVMSINKTEEQKYRVVLHDKD